MPKLTLTNVQKSIVEMVIGNETMIKFKTESGNILNTTRLTIGSVSLDIDNQPGLAPGRTGTLAKDLNYILDDVPSVKARPSTVRSSTSSPMNLVVPVNGKM